MRLLALDTSSDACSVALRLGDDVIEDHVVGAREHTRILIPMIRRLLDKGAVTVGDLDAIVLGNGPGSFIGMRIGASVAQGLAHGAALRIVAVSSLLAVAEEAVSTEAADRVVVIQDARMGDVYFGEFRRGEDGRAIAQDAERIVAADDFPGIEGDFVAAGAGWDRYPGLLSASSAGIRTRSAALWPRSRFLLPAGAAGLGAGAGMRPEDVEPAYLRQKVAEKPS